MNEALIGLILAATSLIIALTAYVKSRTKDKEIRDLKNKLNEVNNGK